MDAEPKPRALLPRERAFTVNESVKRPATEMQVRALEKRIGAALPPDYRRFLRTINGGGHVGGWEWPGVTIVGDLYGIRDDWNNIHEAIDEHERRMAAFAEWCDPMPAYDEGWQARRPPTALIPIARDIGNDLLCLAIRGKDKGSIWYVHCNGDTHSPIGPEACDGCMRQVASSFTAMTRQFMQEVDPPGEKDIARILQEDNANAMRAMLERLPPNTLQESDHTGHTLLERAAGANALKVARLLLKQRATQDHAIGSACTRGHSHPKMIALLLKAGIKPNEHNWAGAGIAGNPAVIRTMLKHTKSPPKCHLAAAFRAAYHNNATPGHCQILRILEPMIGEEADRIKRVLDEVQRQAAARR